MSRRAPVGARRGGGVVTLAGAARAFLFIEQNRVATLRKRSGQGPCVLDNPPRAAEPAPVPALGCALDVGPGLGPGSRGGVFKFFRFAPL